MARRCTAPHAGRKSSSYYAGEASIKFSKVPAMGTGPSSINIQYARSFVKLNQSIPTRFNPDYPHLRKYTTINSTDNKNPVFLGTKNSFNTQPSWLNVVDKNLLWRPSVLSNDGETQILQSLPHHDYHSAKDVILPNTNLFLEKQRKYIQNNR